MKTGFLLPRSSVYPTIGYDFLDGFKSFLSHHGLQTEIATDNIGFGLDEKEVYSKTEAMLLMNNADVVVLFADNRYAAMLGPLFTAMGKILLIVNMGADYPEILSSPSSVIQHGFNTAFNCRLTGKLAAAGEPQSAVMATSYYDGGYLNVYAMVSRYQQAGRAIVYNYISHFKKDQFNTATLQDFLEGHPGEKNLLCIYSGDVSPLIYPAFAALQEQKNLNLYVSPMMLDEHLKQTLGKGFTIQKARGYTSWLSFLDNKSNTAFKESYSKDKGKTPGIFSLLGWETGILVQEIKTALDTGINGLELIDKLTSETLESPRGWLKTDKQTQQTYGPSYLVAVSGNFELTLEEKLDDTGDERQNFINEKPEGSSSGWRNTYLCS